jgi:hypothetical protein
MRVLSFVITLLWLPVSPSLQAAAPLKQVRLLVQELPSDAVTLKRLRLQAPGPAARAGDVVTPNRQQLAILATLPVHGRGTLTTQDDIPATIQTGTKTERTVLRITPDVQPDSSAIVSLNFTREMAGKPSGASFRGSRHLRVGETLLAAPDNRVLVAVTLVEITTEPDPATVPKTP